MCRYIAQDSPGHPHACQPASPNTPLSCLSLCLSFVLPVCPNRCVCECSGKYMQVGVKHSPVTPVAKQKAPNQLNSKHTLGAAGKDKDTSDDASPMPILPPPGRHLHAFFFLHPLYPQSMCCRQVKWLVGLGYSCYCSNSSYSSNS